MTSQDFRLGNYVMVNHKHDILGTVDWIQKDSISVYFQERQDDLSNGAIVPPESIIPIELTEEWLRKLGFDDADYKEGYIGIDVANSDFTLTKPVPNSESVVEKHYTFHSKYGGWPRFRAFEYVHDLQNFFYAFYNKDLTIKKIAND
jgi:hypothetical protein